MPKLPPMPSLSQLLQMYQINAKKQLSQNFLLDMTFNRRFVKDAGSLEDHYVCEVGPGPGGITRAILEKPIKGCVVIEKDPRFIPGLQMLANASGNNMLKIVYGDILDFDMSNVFPKSQSTEWDDSPPKLRIIGNLPFNVSTPLIFRWMEDISHHRGAWSFGRTKMLLTFQDEVADRLVAQPNKEGRCRASVVCQNYCDIFKKFKISGKSFVPPPDVDAGVLLFIPRKEPLIKTPYKVLEKVCKHMFHYRRKHIKHGISTLFPPNLGYLTSDILKQSDVNPKLRSYGLSNEEIGRLCQVYEFYCNKHTNLFDYDYRSQESRKEIREHRMLKHKKEDHSPVLTTHTKNNPKFI